MKIEGTLTKAEAIERIQDYDEENPVCPECLSEMRYYNGAVGEYYYCPNEACDNENTIPMSAPEQDITAQCTARVSLSTGNMLIYLRDDKDTAIGLFDYNGFHPMEMDNYPYRIESDDPVVGGIRWFKVFKVSK